MKTEYRKACECKDATATMPGVTLDADTRRYIADIPCPRCDVCGKLWARVFQDWEKFSIEGTKTGRTRCDKPNR